MNTTTRVNIRTNMARLTNVDSRLSALATEAAIKDATPTGVNQINQRRTIMIISDDALKNKTKGVPASPSFPVAIPMIEQIMMRPKTFVPEAVPITLVYSSNVTLVPF